MSLQRVAKLPFLRGVFHDLATWRAREKLSEIRPHVDSTTSILDIGSGNGVLCDLLRSHGHDVIALDVRDGSFIDRSRPIIYDGARIPFKDLAFDAALLITILHHTPFPERVLGEAKRVSKKVIVIEEIYTNPFNQYLTYFIDSVFNAEFFRHPHTNKTDARWREVFDGLGFKIAHAKYSRSILCLRRATYVLENEQANGSEKRKASRRLRCDDTARGSDDDTKRSETPVLPTGHSVPL